MVIYKYFYFIFYFLILINNYIIYKAAITRVKTKKTKAKIKKQHNNNLIFLNPPIIPNKPLSTITIPTTIFKILLLFNNKRLILILLFV